MNASICMILMQFARFQGNISLEKGFLSSCTLWSTQEESNLDLHKLLKVLQLKNSFK
jgi:hypothetical protein